MVFTLPAKPINSFNTGYLGERSTGMFTHLLILETLVGFIVAISNLIVIAILVMGRKRLMKNHFYIIVANLVFFTSLKAVVEIGFFLPYYAMKMEDKTKPLGYFPSQYQLLIFNISILADYGVLFFSVVIAVNRYLTVARPVDAKDSRSPPSGYFPTTYEQLIFNISILADYGVLFFSVVIAVNRYLTVAKRADAKDAGSHGLRTTILCIAAWISSGIIPLIFYFGECRYTFDQQLKLYYNKCEINIPWINALLNILIYLTYACAIIVFILYLLIFFHLRREKRKLTNTDRPSNKSTVQMKLLRQSLVVFILYACSMLSVFILSFINPGEEGYANIAYVENLLNLSIAAVYPICFVAMSGDMKTILISKLSPNAAGRVSSVSFNNNIIVTPSR